jgi:hypothetical protein
MLGGFVNSVPPTRNVNTTAPLTGGSNLSGDVTLSISTFGASGASHAAGAVPDPGASAGTTHYLREDGTWSVPPSGTGAVSSVGLSAPSILSVANSPITGSGTLTLTLANQNANLFFAGPASGGAATPTFRAIAAGDVPTLNQSTTGTASNITGTLAVGNGGTGATTAAAALSNLGGLALTGGTMSGELLITTTESLSSGRASSLSISPTHAQTGSASSADILITRTETSLGSGGQSFLVCKVGSTTYFGVDHAGNISAAVGSGSISLQTANFGGTLGVTGAATFAGGVTLTSGGVLKLATGGISFDGSAAATITDDGAGELTFVFVSLAFCAAGEIGFYGATPTAQPSASGSTGTAGGSYTANEQKMLQAVFNALKALGLIPS